VSTDALRAYKAARVNTASAGDLLLMLYDAAVRHGKAAMAALDNMENERANTHLLKTQEIISELMTSLNYDVEVSNNLYQLYEYCNRCLVQSNISKRSSGAEQAVAILSELRQTWYQVIKGDRSSNGAVAAGRVASVAGHPFSGAVRGGIELAH